jgi:K+-sensing histidine kinase KdpD
MRKLTFTIKMVEDYVASTGLVLGLASIMLLIGRDTLGEAVIGLLYLIPIGYSAARWGQWPGICAAVIAVLTFNFFFIPPFYTFAIGQLEGWLLLVIFLVVAVVIVGRIQSGLDQARTREREALQLYELSTTLIGQHTCATVAQVLATYLQRLMQARLTQVIVMPDQDLAGVVASAPRNVTLDTKPDRVVPIYSETHGLIGEIHLWRGEFTSPRWRTAERFFQIVATLATLSLERARLAEINRQPA